MSAPHTDEDANAPQAGGAFSPVRSPSHACKLSHVNTWIFDLDNTLYPPHCDLWPKIDMRITLYMCDLLGVDGLSARALQKHYYKQYGTTMLGLIEEHGIAPDHFLQFVHDIDRSSIDRDHALEHGIARLPGRCLIFTNGSRDHALRTSEKLGIAHLFEDVFDIVAGDLIPKPHEAVYEKFFDRHGIDPEKSVLFEDIERNLLVPHQRGMATVLVVPKAGAHDHREDWEILRERPAHIHHVTDDLAGFLGKLEFAR